ncbi:MAG: tRNA (guanosine(37)-N1)-methyltransferase TrmD [Pseudomonadota bacterium]
MSFRASLFTLYPDMFPGTLGQALAGKALADEAWSLETINIRDAATDKHRSVDDTPAGGGPGMVMRADVLARSIDDHVSADDARPRWLMSPRGMPLTQELVRKVADGPGLILVCGRFEGVDERVIEARSLTEISIGDYVLSGGEVAAQVVLDAIVRLLPGVMGNAASASSESFENGELEHPHYTRPVTWEEREIPEVLRSGDHSRIAKWRAEKSRALTEQRRPDLKR